LLRFHSLPELFVAKFSQQLSDEMISKALRLHQMKKQQDENGQLRLVLGLLLDNMLEFIPPTFHNNATRHLLFGMPGIGKTLTVAKLASRYAMADIPASIITTDTKRAGGIEQLKAFTDILDITLQVAESDYELHELLERIPTHMRVIIDTAGCNPYHKDELTYLQRLVEGQNLQRILVAPAGCNPLEAIDMVEAFAALEANQLMITQADSARRFGNVVAAAMAKHIPISHISASADVTQAPSQANAELLADFLLRYRNES